MSRAASQTAQTAPSELIAFGDGRTLDPVLARADVQVALRAVDTEAAGLARLRQGLQGTLGIQLARAVDRLAGCAGRVIVTGIGKSGHVARKIAATLASTGTAALYIHPAEASHGDLGMVRPEDAVLALSWSGETAELSDVVAYTRRFGVELVAITSRVDSALARAADVALVLPELQEACPNGLAPTSSTTAQMVLGDALAICLLSRRGFSAQEFRRFHPGGRLGAQLKRVRELMHAGEQVPLVSLDSALSGAIMAMTGGRFGVTGVVDEGRLVGVLTDGDLRRSFERGFADQPVAGVMNRHPRTIRPDALAAEALAQMNRDSITVLFVVEDGIPVGILHVHDLLRAGLI